MKTFSEIVKSAWMGFVMMSKTFKSIFRFLQTLARKHPDVFVLNETIASVCRCCKRTVIRAIKFFVQMEWLGVVHRKHQSNLYFLVDDLIKFDFNKGLPQNPLFCCENVTSNVTSNVTHTSSYTGFEKKLSNSTSNQAGQAFKMPQKKTIFHPLTLITQLDDSQREKITEDFPEVAIVQALDDAKAYLGWGKKIDDWGKMIYSQARKACNKMKRTT